MQKIIQPATHSQALLYACQLLHAGEVVAFPTETVYGLGADARQDAAVQRIYAVKGRPSHNPLIVHVAHKESLYPEVEWPAEATLLTDMFWPGPLTLVLRRAAGCTLSPLVSAGGDTVAVRMPAHPVARALLQQSGLLLAAPSANRSGAVSPTCAQHVAESLGDVVPLILDGGECAVGIESTVLDMSEQPYRILRHGSVTEEELALVLPEAMLRGAMAEDEQREGGVLRSPGLLNSHYAPRAKVRLQVTKPEPGEGLLAFGDAAIQHTPLFQLSESGNVREAAQRLFAGLRALDALGVETIAVMPIPHAGIGRAINDRLQRAAADRV